MFGVAMGLWGCLDAAVRSFVREEHQLYFWALGSLVLLLVTAAYTRLTDHRVLLDIAGCGLSMGVFDDNEEQTPLLSRPSQTSNLRYSEATRGPSRYSEAR